MALWPPKYATALGFIYLFIHIIIIIIMLSLI